MGFYIFRTPKPRQFSYTPRYYDPNKDALEKKKAAMGLDSNLTEQEKLRMKMRTKWGMDPETGKVERKKIGFKGMRFVIFFGILALFIYIIFFTPLVDNFIAMFLHIGNK